MTLNDRIINYEDLRFLFYRYLMWNNHGGWLLSQVRQARLGKYCYRVLVPKLDIIKLSEEKTCCCFYLRPKNNYLSHLRVCQKTAWDQLWYTQKCSKRLLMFFALYLAAFGNPHVVIAWCKLWIVEIFL